MRASGHAHRGVPMLRFHRVGLTSRLTSLTSAAALCLLGALWIGWSAQVTGADDASPGIKAIVEKAIAFHGGAKLGRDLALVRTEESEMILDGDKVSLTCEWQYQPPDKRALHAIVKIGGLQLNVRQGLVGDKGWVKVGPSVPVDLTPEQVHGLAWEHDNHLKSVMTLAAAETGYDATDPKPARFNDRDAWQITFTNKQTKNKVTAFFDKKTGQCLGDESERVVSTLASNHQREKPATYRVLFKSFIDVDGMKLPEKLEIQRDGKAVVEVLKAQVRVVDKIDPSVFAKP
jgi:hypothetical protein